MLTPGRYVGAEEAEDDGVPFDEKFTALKVKLEEQFKEGRKHEESVRSLLSGVTR